MSRRIYYFTPSLETPRGGIKQIYRHVEILSRNGFDASIVTRRPGFRPTWFANTAKTVDLVQFKAAFRAGQDVIVLPEILGQEILLFPPRRVIFNQNVFMGFNALDEVVDENPYLGNDVHVLVVSDHNAELLRHAYPRAAVHRVYNGVDATRFTSRPLAEKQRRIVFPVAKGVDTNSALQQILASRAAQGLNRMQGFEWIGLRGKTEAQVATIFEESLICLFASVTEGLALIPIEAMLAGCILLTHGNGPQRECTPAAFLHEQHDILGMARTIEDIVADMPASLARWQPICDAARANVAAEYSLAREEASVLAAWEAILRNHD